MTEDKAKARLLVLTLVKLSAAAMIIFGLFNLMQPTMMMPDRFSGLSLGVAFMLAGLADLVLVPRLLRRAFEKQDRE